jgi:hypothetical protein
MFWWFERGGQFLRYEARDLADGGFELRVVAPDGTERVEVFADSAELTRRQVDFEKRLASDGWSGPHGWNL